MTFDSLLSMMMRLDIRWTVHGEGLRVDAPCGVLTNEIREEIRRHKRLFVDLASRCTPDGHASGEWRDRIMNLAAVLEFRAAQAASGLRDLVRTTEIADPEKIPTEWREEFEERAAIREYDGGQPRGLAESEALDEVMQRMQSQEGK